MTTSSQQSKRGSGSSERTLLLASPVDGYGRPIVSARMPLPVDPGQCATATLSSTTPVATEFQSVQGFTSTGPRRPQDLHAVLGAVKAASSRIRRNMEVRTLVETEVAWIKI